LQSDSPLFGLEIGQLIELLGAIIDHSKDRPDALLLTHHIYFWRARSFVADNQDRERCLGELRSYLSQVKYTHKLPIIDLLEFQFIEDELSRSEQGVAEKPDRSNLEPEAAGAPQDEQILRT
jgi:hypothetical protein